MMTVMKILIFILKNNFICFLFQIIMNVIEYSRKCDRGDDCTCRQKFKFSIEPFDAITGECILENQKEFT